MRTLLLLSLLLLIGAISAKKQHQENIDAVEPETQEHSSQKYTKDHQKTHHHKHKKHSAAEELMSEPEPKPKQAPIEVPEPEIELQENLATNKKAIHSKKHAEQVEDLHLQDLAYEEKIKKEKRKGHHGAHQAEILEKTDEKLFADKESKHAVDEKVIEDSFEPLKKETTENGKKHKNKDKKQKDKSKNKKKAYEKKDKSGKKSKEGKKNGKDKKNKKNKEKKY